MKTERHYLAEGTQVEGKLISQDDISIDGVVVGSIEGHKEVIFEAKGRMEGPVRAPVITIKGRVKGDIFSNQRLEILPGGEIQGNITTLSGGLIVKEGGIMNSNISVFEPGSGTKPHAEPKKQNALPKSP